MRICALGVMACVISACGGDPAPLAGKPPQTPKQAMELVCDAIARSGAGEMAPGERQRHIANWIGATVTNEEVRALVARFGSMDPAERGAAHERYGLVTCALTRPSASSLGARLNTPEVTRGGVVADVPEAPILLIKPASIVVDGKAIVAVVDGAVDPAELEGSAQGTTIPRLRSYLDALQRASPGKKLMIAVDRTLSYRLLFAVVLTASLAGYVELPLLVRKAGQAAVIPLALPSWRAPSAQAAVASASVGSGA